MATDITKLIDLQRLSEYDVLIKGVISEGDALAIKTVLWDSTNEQIKFYKKADASLSDTPDYSVTIASSDVESLKTRVGLSTTLNSYQSATNLTAIMNILTGDSTTAGSVAKAAADAVSTAEGYTDTAIAALDADLDASGTAQHSGTFVVSGVTQVDGQLTAVDSVEVEAAGAAAALAATLSAVATSGDADDVAYDNTTSGLQSTDVQNAIDEVVAGLGTAAAADVATTAITEESEDDSLVSAAQVSAFVAQEISDLEGAMHFRGVVTRQTGETDLEAIERTITDPEPGDVVILSDNSKEYVYSNSTIGWREIGDESAFVLKSQTIAGVDLQDNITKTELLAALNVEDGAEVNIIESVKVNGSALTPDANRAVDVLIAEGTTDGTISVNSSDIAVHGLGSAAFAETTDFDAAGTASSAVSTAIAALDSSTDDNTVTDTADTSLNLLTSVTIQDGVITAKKHTALNFASSAEIEALFE